MLCDECIMNNKTVLVIAVILAFATGAISTQMIYSSIQETPKIIYANGTKIMMLNDESYYPEVIKRLNEANKSIHMVMYEIKWYGEPGNDTHWVSTLALSLVHARERGVDVKIILEDGHGYDYTSENIVEYAQNWSKYFQRHGIEVRLDSPTKTTHDKLIIIDGVTVILGSTNWSTAALKYNHEANVLIQGRTVAQEYEEYFESLWQGL